MISVLLCFIVSALVIVIAGSFLTKFADQISDETGLGRVLAGGILLASATSLPEFMVDLNALDIQKPNLAVGDLLGSSLFNLLILAILDFTFPSTFKRTAFSSDFLHHSLAAVLSILLTAIVGIGIISEVKFSLLGVGVFTWILLITYLFGLRMIYFDRKSDPTYLKVLKDKSFQTAVKSATFYRALVGYILAAIAILVAAPFLARSADELATMSGLGHTFIGTTLVALATSLPELVSTLTAFKMGAPDLALGNIFGSNTFNMVLLVPLDFLYPDILLNSVHSIHAVTAMSIVAVTTVAVMGQLYRKKERLRFAEPSSEIIVVLIIMFLFLLYFLRQ